MKVEPSSTMTKESGRDVADIYFGGVGYHSNSPFRDKQIEECLKQCQGALTFESASLIGNDADSLKLLKQSMAPGCRSEIISNSYDTITGAIKIASQKLTGHSNGPVFIIHNEPDSTSLFLLTTESTGAIARIESIGSADHYLPDFLTRENKYIVSSRDSLSGLDAHHAWVKVVDFNESSPVEVLHDLILSINSKQMLPGASLNDTRSKLQPVEVKRPWVKVGIDSTRNGALILNDSGAEENFLHLSESTYHFPTDRETEIFLLGASSREELIENSLLLIELIQKKNFVLRDLAFTINCKYKREESSYRLGIVSKDLAETIDRLMHAVKLLQSDERIIENETEGIYFASSESAIKGKSVFILPGLGSAYEGMLEDLYENDRITQNVFDYLDDLARMNSSESLPSEVIFPGQKSNSKQTESLLKADFAVVAVAMSSYAIDSFLKEVSIIPDAYLGMSTGEFANHVLNGYTDIETAAPLFYDLSISVAGKLPKEENDFVTVNLFCSASCARQAMDEVAGEVYLIADLGPKHVMITGEKSSVDMLVENLARSFQVVSHKMPAPILYHTPLIDSSLTDQEAESFSNSINGTTISIPSWSASLAGIAPTDKKEMESAFKNMLKKPIRFRETIEEMYESGFRKFIEIGPSGILTSKVKEILSGKFKLVMASNLANQPATTQLNHVIARMYCHGENPYLGYLYTYGSYKFVNLASDEQNDSYETTEISSPDIVVSNYFSMLNSVHDTVTKANQEILRAYLNNLNPLGFQLIDEDKKLVLCWFKPGTECSMEQWLVTHFNQHEIADIQNRFSDMSSKRAFILGRVAAKESVAKSIDLEYEGLDLNRKDIEIKYDSDDAPIVSCPTDKKPVVSIAHKDDFACALSMLPADNYSIGVDVEKIKPLDDSIIDLVLSKAEYEYISTLEKNNELSFLKIWTAKEALFKAFHGQIKLTEFKVKELKDDTVILTHSSGVFEINLKQIESYIIAIALTANSISV